MLCCRKHKRRSDADDGDDFDYMAALDFANNNVAQGDSRAIRSSANVSSPSKSATPQLHRERTAMPNSPGSPGSARRSSPAVTPGRTDDEFSRRYRLGRQIGVGRFAGVFECLEKESRRKYAVKVIDKNFEGGKFIKSFKREVAILKIVRDHPSFITMRDIIETQSTLYIVTDLMQGGDLLQKLMDFGPRTEDQARAILKKLLEAVDFLHSKDILHRDLKPENILLGKKTGPDDADDEGIDDDFVLCDFGHSALGQDRAGGFGTHDYLAPEVIREQRTHPGSDVWSVGVIAYILLSATFPFCSTDEQRMVKEILAGEFNFRAPLWSKVSDEAKDFISHLLVVDERKRASAQDALQHPWLTGRRGRGRQSSDQGSRGSSPRGGRSRGGDRGRGRAGRGGGSRGPRSSYDSTGSDGRQSASWDRRSDSRGGYGHSDDDDDSWGRDASYSDGRDDDSYNSQKRRYSDDDYDDRRSYDSRDDEARARWSDDEGSYHSRRDGSSDQGSWDSRDDDRSYDQRDYY